MNPWIQYSIIRLALFAALLALLLLLGVDWLVATIIAALGGFCLSYIFLQQQREAAIGSISGRTRPPGRDPDAAEDDALDRAEQ